MQHRTLLSAAFFAVSALALPIRAEPQIPDSSLYVPKPSQDPSWAYGAWVAKNEHPVLGAIVEWRVTIHPNGRYAAEWMRPDDSTPTIERGVWVAVDRDVWSFAATERDRKAIDLGAVALELYTIQAITSEALELRHAASGKLLRLERAGT